MPGERLEVTTPEIPIVLRVAVVPVAVGVGPFGVLRCRACDRAGRSGSYTCCSNASECSESGGRASDDGEGGDARGCATRAEADLRVGRTGRYALVPGCAGCDGDVSGRSTEGAVPGLSHGKAGEVERDGETRC